VITKLEEQLFGQDCQLYAILDGAAVDDLPGTLWDLAPAFECLYRGELTPDVAAVAPYLARLERHHPFTTWMLGLAVERQHCGIFVVSDAVLPALRQHFRRLLTVHGEDGEPMLFRFYDPRVLPAYLSTCTDDELSAFCGPVRKVLLLSNETLVSLPPHVSPDTRLGSLRLTF
jgi:hypothetical protein